VAATTVVAMKTVSIDGWLAMLAGVVALGVAYTLLELAKRLSSPAEPHARVGRVLCGTAVVGLGLWCTSVVAVLAVESSQWTSVPAARLIFPLPFALLGPAASLTILSAGRPSIRRISCAAAAMTAGLFMTAHFSELHFHGTGSSQLVFGPFFGFGPANNMQLLALVVVALGLAVLIGAHVITVYAEKLELRTRRFARELEAVHSRLKYVATHDSLTGLPNWLALKERLTAIVGDTERPGRAIAVAVIDLDRYGSLIHSLGHGAGTGLLTEVARRVAALLRPEDTLARLGSEFVVLIDSVSARVDAQSVTAEILAGLRKPMSING